MIIQLGLSKNSVFEKLGHPDRIEAWKDEGDIDEIFIYEDFKPKIHLYIAVFREKVVSVWSVDVSLIEK